MKNNQLRQVVFPILAAFIWGTAFVAQDVCADAMGAFTFNGTRYYIAVLSLLVVLAVSSGFRKDRPQISPAEKKAQRRQLWLGGFCCGTVLAIASNFQQAGLVAGTGGGKAGFITALYVVLVPVFGLFFRRRVSLPVWIAVAPVRGCSVPAVHQGQLLPGPRRPAGAGMCHMLFRTYPGDRPFHRHL